MSKFEKVSIIQLEYRRGLCSMEDAKKRIRQIMQYPITDKYLDWLLFEFEFN